MFDTILIANRGEIACRVIDTARRLGLRTVAVYSDADRDARHVKLADDAVHIGGSAPADSYLRGDAIIAAAQQAGAQAIHPGYGFLSENEAFAAAVGAAGLAFIGAPASAIAAMGNKAAAKRLMIAAGVPCVPGYEGEDQSDAALTEAAAKIGFPLMIKAAAGGGGRGMRIVHGADDLAAGLQLARSEAENAFGSGELILEKAVIAPRHVEVQVFADDHGTTLHLGERDCSVQRRHQKVLEEAPCPVMTPELRKEMTDAAIAAARAVDYRGAGTVEFLLDASGAFYFLEMNTRLQVEHPVTEAITGLDLVELQIIVAQGLPLPLAQADVRLDGHAIEARLYAEDPGADFAPATGPIALWQAPDGEGMRTDTGIETGGEVSPFYDSMLAKVIGIGPSRDVARRRLVAGLKETALLGLTTNRGFLIDALNQPGFADGSATTAFIAETYPDGVDPVQARPADFALTAVLIHCQDRDRLFAQSTVVSVELLDWHSVAPLPNMVTLIHGETEAKVSVSPVGNRFDVRCGDDSFVATVQSMDDTGATLTLDGRRVTVSFTRWGNRQFGLRLDTVDLAFTIFDPLTASGDDAGGSRIVAPMPGVVVSINVAPGDEIEKGQTLAVLEAMKMQHQITATRDGQVREVVTRAGAQLTAGALMIALEEDAP